jgi:hypothetical protein
MLSLLSDVLDFSKSLFLNDLENDELVLIYCNEVNMVLFAKSTLQVYFYRSTCKNNLHR